MFNPIEAITFPLRIAKAILDVVALSADELDAHEAQLEAHEYPDQVNYDAEEFEDWLEIQTTERTQLAAIRAIRHLGWDVELDQILEDLSPEDLETFGLATLQVFTEMYVADTLEGLARRGMVVGTVMPDGQMGYQITPAGEAAYALVEGDLPV